MTSSTRRLALAVALSIAAGTASAAGLGAHDRRYVDDIRIDAAGAVTLLLVVDRPLEDGLTKESVKRKLRGYREWVHDPKFSRNFPSAKPAAGLFVLIVHPAARNALGRSVLEQIEGYAREIGFTPRLRVTRPGQQAT